MPIINLCKGHMYKLIDTLNLFAMLVAGFLIAAHLQSNIDIKEYIAKGYALLMIIGFCILIIKSK